MLILGSMPGVRSLEAGEYYAHKQNQFWKITGALLGFAPDASYAARTRALVRNGVALWDVLEACVRPGSLDADISDAVPNDFDAFLAKHRKIERIGLNGGTAWKYFRRHVEIPTHIECVRLPSTSPAYAAMKFEKKLALWKRELGL